jgi:hypothetical protein
VDDALALLMLLHLPKEDVELLGITTAYGYTQVRECFEIKPILFAIALTLWCACGRACAVRVRFGVVRVR